MIRTELTLRWVARIGPEMQTVLRLQQQVLEYEEVGYPPKKIWVDVPLVQDGNEQIKVETDQWLGPTMKAAKTAYQEERRNKKNGRS